VFILKGLEVNEVKEGKEGKEGKEVRKATEHRYGARAR